MDTPAPAYLYKILPHPSVDSAFTLPSPLPADYNVPLPKLDHDDGFVHLSAASQLATTLALFFADVPAVLVLKLAASSLEKRGKLEWLGPDGQSRPPPYACAHGWVTPVAIRGQEVVGVIAVLRDDQGWDAPLDAYKAKGFLV